MDLDLLEGFIEVRGRYPILITALHGFGSDGYRDAVKALRRCIRHLGFVKSLDIYDKLGGVLRYGSAVDLFTWEIAYKVAVAEELWGILPTLSKIDRVYDNRLPDYNLNKSYASATRFWRRVRELIEVEGIRVIVDIHGMKNIRRWPDICISTRGYTSVSRELVERVATVLRTYGYRVEIDHPFIGGAFIAEFGKPPTINAIAIEIKKNLRFYGSQIPLLLREVIKVAKRWI